MPCCFCFHEECGTGGWDHFCYYRPDEGCLFFRTTTRVGWYPSSWLKVCSFWGSTLRNDHRNGSGQRDKGSRKKGVGSPKTGAFNFLPGKCLFVYCSECENLSACSRVAFSGECRRKTEPDLNTCKSPGWHLFEGWNREILCSFAPRKLPRLVGSAFSQGLK